MTNVELTQVVVKVMAVATSMAGRGDRGGPGTSSRQVKASIAKVFNSKFFSKKNDTA
jgi:hypothetical protein